MDCLLLGTWMPFRPCAPTSFATWPQLSSPTRGAGRRCSRTWSRSSNRSVALSSSLLFPLLVIADMRISRRDEFSIIIQCMFVAMLRILWLVVKANLFCERDCYCCSTEQFVNDDFCTYVQRWPVFKGKIIMVVFLWSVLRVVSLLGPNTPPPHPISRHYFWWISAI